MFHSLCDGEGVYVFARERKRTNVLTHLCPLGTRLKISSSSGLLVSEQRLSALSRHPYGPPLLLASLHLSITHTRALLPHSFAHSLCTHNRAHTLTPTTPSCVPALLPAPTTSGLAACSTGRNNQGH